MTDHVITYKRALAAIPADRRHEEVLEGESFSAGLYAPHESDDQGAHDRDVVYVVVNGSGFFQVDGDRAPFGPGDLCHADAGVEHRFEDFTPDFAVWRIFGGDADE